METNFPRQLLDAHKANIPMVIVLILKVVTRMTVFRKRNLKRRRLLLSQRKKTNYQEKEQGL